jgi:pimeloyl-ACP methyl ester carboxylesterase
VLTSLPGGLLGARHGDAPARAVALHGWVRTHADFESVLPGLDAVAPDLPGFGATAPPSAAWGSADYALAARPLCDEGPPVVLLGHSFGGRVALMLAADYPERVAGLVLTAVPLLRPGAAKAPSTPLRYRAARRLNRAGLISDDRMEAMRRRSGSEDYRAARGVMRDVLVRVTGETGDGTYRRALARVRCPVEFVWGELDRVTPPGIVEEAVALVPGPASVTILPGVGHLTPTEAPAELHAALVRRL